MPEQCNLFGAFGWGVQCFLAVSCFSSLIYKRIKEYPQRPWKVFLMDVSKQAISAGLAHILNVLIAVVLSTWEEDDPCVWYFLNLLIDTTVGVLICYGLLMGVERLAQNLNWTRLKTGRYWSKDHRQKLDFCAWGLQLLCWCLIVGTVKGILALFIYSASKGLSVVGTLLLSWLEPYPQLELMFVMILVPLVMNCMQFWVQDTFLKDKTTETKSIPLVEISQTDELLV